MLPLYDISPSLSADNKRKMILYFAELLIKDGPTLSCIYKLYLSSKKLNFMRVLIKGEMYNICDVQEHVDLLVHAQIVTYIILGRSDWR